MNIKVRTALESGTLRLFSVSIITIITIYINKRKKKIKKFKTEKK